MSHDSASLIRLAHQRMPGGVSTNVRLAEGPERLIVERASGCRVFTSDGRELLDYVSGFGSILLGFGAPVLLECQRKVLSDGMGFTATSADEIEAADRLLAVHQRFDMVRFCTTGSEATTAAISLARAATGRRSIAVFTDHYHGWHGPTREAGIDARESRPAQEQTSVYRLPFGDVTACERFLQTRGSRLACVILELVMGSSGQMISPELLSLLSRARAQHGFLLIADEVITGFRVGLRGAQHRFGVTADLAVFGKCLGGGLPIGALVGPRELMMLFATGAAMHAGTFNGHALSVASAAALIRYLSEHEQPFYAALGDRGEQLRSGLQKSLESNDVRGSVDGPGALLVLTLPPIAASGLPAAALLTETLNQQGIRIAPGGRWFLNAAHTASDIDRAVNSVDQFLRALVAQGAFE